MELLCDGTKASESGVYIYRFVVAKAFKEEHASDMGKEERKTTRRRRYGNWVPRK